MASFQNDQTNPSYPNTTRRTFKHGWEYCKTSTKLTGFTPFSRDGPRFAHIHLGKADSTNSHCDSTYKGVRLLIFTKTKKKVATAAGFGPALPRNRLSRPVLTTAPKSPVIGYNKTFSTKSKDTKRH